MAKNTSKTKKRSNFDTDFLIEKYETISINFRFFISQHTVKILRSLNQMRH